MKLDSSLHTHNTYCDGDDSMEDMVRAAIDAGLKTIGISSHAPLPFETEWTMKPERVADYQREVRELAEKYRDQIEVLFAFEVDFIPDERVHVFQTQQVFPLSPDYLIGSIHFLGHTYPPTEIDGEEAVFRQLLEDEYDGSIELMGRDFYARVRDLARCEWVQIMGHIDRLKRWNADSRYFSEEDAWYRGEVEKTLGIVNEAGVTVEINTSGWRNGAGNPYPSPWVIDECRSLGIPLLITADAHAISQITYEFAAAANLLS